MPDVRELQIIDLLPGEAFIELKDDPFYGSVDIGAGKRLGKAQSPRATTTRMQGEITAGLHALDATKQNHVETLTGKRLQQREAGNREDLPDVGLPEPTLASLNPNEAVVGSTPFTLRLLGENFAEGCTIVWNGGDEPTTRVSATELTTQVQPATASGPVTIPVLVRNPDDVESNALDFTFTAQVGEAGALADKTDRNDKDDKDKPKGAPAGKHAPTPHKK